MEAIHRDDGELCGFVHEHEGRWQALTVFGAHLADTESAAAARAVVHEIGLASLAERWLFHDGALSEPEVVCIQEASPQGVTVALGYYSMPGVPTVRITRDQIDSGVVRLRRSP